MFQKLAQLEVESALPLATYAQFLERHQRYEEATMWWRKAVARDPGDERLQAELKRSLARPASEY
jgi:hypothetical protein